MLGKIRKLTIILIIICISFSLSMSDANAVVNSRENVKYHNVQESKKAILVNRNNKLFLKQKWYGMEFEVNPAKKIGVLELKAIGQKEYKKAIDEVSFPIEQLGEYHIYFLDYKLKDYANAIAINFLDDSAVVFGTYWIYTTQIIHRVAVHELGHQIDFKLMNDKLWTEYKKLRGITNEQKYNNYNAEHHNRPQEIFAEDFRLLFGGETAIELPHLNENIDDVNQQERIKQFFMTMIGDN